MNKLKKRTIGFHIMIAAAVALCGGIASAIALYIRGVQLTTAVPAEQYRTETLSSGIAPNVAFHTPNHEGGGGFFYVPSLAALAPCTRHIPQPPAPVARSAVLIDAASGALLFEKNPDQSIPPASLTKLVAIYTAMQAVERGEISLTDTVTPPREAWAVNMPPGSSLMFLGQNQKVSVEELLLGMSVVSGNDAAVALAVHTAGSVPAFVKRMNKAIAALGLRNTHFEDSNGLSEYNYTTARDFARFSAVYVKKYPDHLQRFHSVREFSYPQPHNMLTPQTVIRQPATNTLLSALDGCDGIKTGFIYESGFNIALTAQRNGIRFIAVILGGAGKNSREGKTIREQNGTTLMEWAFSHFATVYARDFPLQAAPVPVIGAQEQANRTALLAQLSHPDGNNAAFTVPLSGKDFTYDTAAIHTRILLPLALSAPITAGQKIGRVQFWMETEDGERLLAEFPLVADKELKRGSRFRWKYDSLALKFRRFLRHEKRTGAS